MSTGASPPQSNLPEPSYTGAFTAYVSVDIDAPIDKVWDVLADFTKYPECQVIVDKSKKPLEDQTPAKGKYLLMETHIPPTMDDSVSSTEAFEQITHFDDVTRRMAWKNLLPSWLIKAERWQVLSTTEDGKTRYESREVFGSIGAYLIKWFLSTNLMKSFNAMGDALKARSEQQ
ncbi:hypothetical protein L226DRAFT_459831 [Lentinus tigrinus ALCF2SS1-7]|uniref:Coenzyme Q-binding protein COQ10 START domain-containing protein n=1 Tax=Lentinus tigrinus ALCF2SS1-6 TaxID=1328759 RepID=A0A5C2SHZ3_9APHY|nr:hypothetical protein L227DRAFT_497281 [Lentinus tigrinus ALCF2SS1-6]RPD77174.1 hypothetical protein L226DRAFT_459831 [Lentinus tigrinus ALCF2SS1-7]